MTVRAALHRAGPRGHTAAGVDVACGTVTPG